MSKGPCPCSVFCLVVTTMATSLPPAALASSQGNEAALQCLAPPASVAWEPWTVLVLFMAAIGVVAVMLSMYCFGWEILHPPVLQDHPRQWELREDELNAWQDGRIERRISRWWPHRDEESAEEGTEKDQPIDRYRQSRTTPTKSEARKWRQHRRDALASWQGNLWWQKQWRDPDVEEVLFVAAQNKATQTEAATPIDNPPSPVAAEPWAKPTAAVGA